MRRILQAGAMVAAASVVLAGTALAQDMATKTVEVSGTMVGNTGGAFQSWNVDMPKNTDVSLNLAHWPCNTGDAVGFEVWTAAGLAGRSHEKDACNQALAWNTGDGGKAEIKLYNYLPDVGTWWSMAATGMTLPGAIAPAAAAAPAKSMTDTTMADTTMAPKTTTAAMAPAAAAAPAAMAPATGGVMVDNAVLYGDAGGAYAKYDFMVKNGQKYEVMLQASSPNGGSWPAVGFGVFGPTGQMASASVDATGMASTSFTATGNDKYTVSVYNYHTGVPMFYHLHVKDAN